MIAWARVSAYAFVLALHKQHHCPEIFQDICKQKCMQWMMHGECRSRCLVGEQLTKHLWQQVLHTSECLKMPNENLNESASRAFTQAGKFLPGGNWRTKSYADPCMHTA